MIFLLNYERVRVEVAELTRFRIAQVLHISPTDITIEIQKDENGRLAQAWAIRALPEGMSSEKARGIAVEVGRYLNKNYLIPRLQDAQRTAREARGG